MVKDDILLNLFNLCWYLLELLYWEEVVDIVMMCACHMLCYSDCYSEVKF